MKRLLTVLLAAAALLALPAAAFAQCPKTSLGDIEKDVMCPQCGTSLALATEAPQAQAQRRFIEKEIAACRSKDEIIEALVAEFGPAVRALPEDDGVDVAVYLIPVVVLFISGIGVAFVVASWRRMQPAEPHDAQPDPERLPPEDEERLEADMKKSGI